MLKQFFQIFGFSILKHKNGDKFKKQIIFGLKQEKDTLWLVMQNQDQFLCLEVSNKSLNSKTIF
jgi:hypothetical protein